jgi:hypothetical protein
MNNGTPARASQPAGLKKAGLYFYRSLRLRCPVCGRSPLFNRYLKQGILWIGLSRCPVVLAATTFTIKKRLYSLFANSPVITPNNFIAKKIVEAKA